MFNLELPWRVAKGAVSEATYRTLEGHAKRKTKTRERSKMTSLELTKTRKK